MDCFIFENPAGASVLAETKSNQSTALSFVAAFWLIRGM